ncbi:nicotianamine synthase family protein [Methanosarcina sp. T3]|uniref:nicotianamine synthase family protein n=1 Tax=Methanosarcina sp. T3 TaxID=3439062 RepID=UPI003F859389
MASGVGEKFVVSPEYIVEEILGLYRDIRNLPDEEILYGTSNRNTELFRKLESLINLEIEDSVAWEILKKKELEPAFTEINRFRNLYTVKLETEHANEILVSNSPGAALGNFPFYGNYLKLVRTEYEGLGLSPGDRVFFLGSGPLPLTLIVFFRRYGIKSVGIEQDPTRADLSRKVLEKLGLSEAITIINGNHFSLNGKDLSLSQEMEIKALMIAAQAEPKKEIFEHLLEVMPAGSRISCRIYEKGLRKLLNGNCLFDLPEGFEEKARVYPEPPVYNTVVLLEKKR